MSGLTGSNSTPNSSTTISSSTFIVVVVEVVSIVFATVEDVASTT